jgi:hypothetical protein
MHGSRPLSVQELPGPFQGPDIDASGGPGAGPAALSGHQPLRQVHDQAVHGEGWERRAKRRVEGA